ncbi:MAG: hypothetical protein F6K23_27710 [Okeania sp. SIO2C9]|uniref:hypothetical protein n=1 Tax=Okeania sp. SIO2C9 TaxID=2607791 RepID=UPI0013BFC135|nr:hypothetical protein [Okeania sp. SIO2C9]NEQ76488.1 hypothetical protein [Okeania sp. SIO2C9]
MALAILRFQDNDGAKSRFKVDIGSNRFYIYCIGNEELQRSQGLKVLSNPKFTSPLIGPLPESSLGRTILEVPVQQFDRQNRYIQIISYRNQQRDGPAISEIIQVNAINSYNSDPVMSFSKATAMENYPVDTVPFAYKEVQPVSSALFLKGVLKVAKKVATPLLKKAAPLIKKAAPVVGKMADKLIPGSGKLISAVIPELVDVLAGNISPEEILSDPSKVQAIFTHPEVTRKLSSDPKAAELFGSLLQELAQDSAPAPSEAASALAVVGNGKVTNHNNSLLSLEQSIIPATPSSSLATAKSVSSGSNQYSSEMAIPVALVTILPSLMPLLEKVMSRPTRRMLREHNITERKRMGLITHGLLDASRSFRGGSHFNREMTNAFSLTEEDGDKAVNTAVNTLLQGLSVGLSAPSSTPDYERVDSVKLEFTEQNTLMMQGRSRLLYRQDQTIAFPLEVETPRTITKGILQILVKDPTTLEVLIEEKYRLENITSGMLSVVPKLSSQRLRSLKANEEYLVCAVLVWPARSRKTRRKKRLGTSMSQLITLVGEYCFDRLEGTGEVIPLNDVNSFRPYWHKIWEGNFANNIRRTTLDCKYYYALEPGRTNHSRMETVTKIEPTGGSREEGKLKTGLILSAYRLNELLGQISAYPLLDEAQLRALLSSEFQEQFSYCARDSVEFKGRRGDVVGLWVYPEFKLQRVLLKQAGQTNGNGQVLALGEREVYFPMPAVVHFVGVYT